MMARIRILLADDHTVMRRGLRLLLEQQADFQVVGEADDGRQAVELAAPCIPTWPFWTSACPCSTALRPRAR